MSEKIIFGYDRKDENVFVPNGYHKDYRYIKDVSKFKDSFGFETTVNAIDTDWTDTIHKTIDSLKDSEKFIYHVEQFGAMDKVIGQEDRYEIFCFLKHMKSNTIEKIKQKKGIIVISAFEESRISLDNLRFLHNKLKEYRLNPNSLVYITGNNWSANKHYLRWCEQNNQKYHLKVINSHQQMYLKGFDLTKKHNSFVSIEDLNKDRRRNHRLLCFNRRIRPHRYTIIAMLHHHKLLKNNLVSFSLERGKDLNHLGSDRKPDLHTMTQLCGKTKIRDTYMSYFDELNKMSPQTIDYENLSQVMGPGHENREPYLNSYFSVVTETAFVENSYFSSEKIYRPMLHYHPFILYGSPFTLKVLKELGFRTFHPFIDESYDEIISPQKRAISIFNEIKRLCRMSENEIHDWFLGLKDILIHNRELIYEKGKEYKTNAFNIFDEIYKEL